MTAPTTTTSRSRHKARYVVLALALAVCTLTTPAIANALTIDSDSVDPGYSSVNAISGGSGDATQPTRGSDYSSVNSIVPPKSERGGSGGPSVDSGYSSPNAITGAPADTPTFVSSSPTGAGGGFDWPSALVGGGAVLALTALGTAGLLSVRRRSTVGPSPSTS